MIRPFVCALGFAFAAAIVGMLAPVAQTEDVLDACEPGKQEIEAAALPGVVEPGECPIAKGAGSLTAGSAASFPGPGRAFTRRS